MPPGAETSSYRSNPMRLAEFTLSRKDPEYVNRAKSIYNMELKRRKIITGSEGDLHPEIKEQINYLKKDRNIDETSEIRASI